MMVLFTSRSEKKAILTVRKILDNYADRIGNDTWQTVITQEGLTAVKTLLRKAATKSMAVACRWMRSRTHSELLWIVGNRDKFNMQGVVPVNTTERNLLHHEWEGDWKYLPLIKALVGMAGLLHDWGKASDYFQQKLLSREKTADPFRHEWISCKLIEALVKMSGEEESNSAWLSLLCSDKVNEKRFLSQLKETSKTSGKLSETLPPIAQSIIWLILSHHRMPFLSDDNKRYQYENTDAENMSVLLTRLTAEWGYGQGDENKRAMCFKFSKGLLWENKSWRKQLKKWAERLLSLKDEFMALWSEPAEKTALRPVLIFTREALMLGDHYISSLPEKDISEEGALWANTDRQGSLKQTLLTHLLKVTKQSLVIAHNLPVFVRRMDAVEDIHFHASKEKKYAWQEKAVHAIRGTKSEENKAWFIVNMASTGCGKTTANAKIAQAISPNGKALRFILALGLRTLTLQTGTEYRERIGLDDDEFATLIGSKAIERLYNQAQDDKKKAAEAAEKEMVEDTQGAGAEELLSSELDFEDNFSKEQIEFLNQFFEEKGNAAKNRAFLYKPVLALTIDHIMGAVETIRGGRHLLPILRLMSSDIVIDEIDDFSVSDLTAVARLVHLAGMLGHNVVISSATIPPDLAVGMERAYQDGLSCYNSFVMEKKKLSFAWVDEFRSAAFVDDGMRSFDEMHAEFIAKRVKSLRDKSVQIKRKAYIVDCEDIPKTEEEQGYYAKIRETAEKLHEEHYVIDTKTGKHISFGLIRIANIEPCVACCRYLMNTEWKENTKPYLMCYHSRQVLLLRHVQESYLDEVLNRKKFQDRNVDFIDEELRRDIDGTDAENIIFIVVATPVEEIGRDHDFDWAIVEPSSYRSLIQLAGRILRHRELPYGLAVPNIAVMQYNRKGFLATNSSMKVFCHPGYEESLRLETHDLKKLVDEDAMKERIDAVPRVQRKEKLDAKHSLIDLEHYCMEKWRSLEKKGPQSLAGWQQTFWWMTALPQQLHRFRANDGREEQQRFYVYNAEKENLSFREKVRGEFIEHQALDGITWYETTVNEQNSLWLNRDYLLVLPQYVDNVEEDEGKGMQKASQRYGEITWAEYGDKENKYWYSDVFGLFKKE